jgi:hypothetical protein
MPSSLPSGVAFDRGLDIVGPQSPVVTVSGHHPEIHLRHEDDDDEW